MFIASKYEDIYPLLMKTMFNKIGHQKFSVERIMDKEIEILRVLGFKVGAPTALEFLSKYLEESKLRDHPQSSFLSKIALYLCKLQLHNYSLA